MCPSCGNEYENENYLNMHHGKCSNQRSIQNYDEVMLSEGNYSESSYTSSVDENQIVEYIPEGTEQYVEGLCSSFQMKRKSDSGQITSGISGGVLTRKIW